MARDVDIRRLKDEAAEYFRKAKFDKAAKALEEIVALEPRDVQHRLKLGDAYRRDNQKEKAIAAYRTAADAFAQDNQVIKAIAACKLILEIDPSHHEAQTSLADLVLQRYGKPTGAAPRGKRSPAPGAVFSPVSSPASVAPRRTSPPLDPSAAAVFPPPIQVVVQPTIVAEPVFDLEEEPLVPETPSATALKMESLDPIFDPANLEPFDPPLPPPPAAPVRSPLTINLDLDEPRSMPPVARASDPNLALADILCGPPAEDDEIVTAPPTGSIALPGQESGKAKPRVVIDKSRVPLFSDLSRDAFIQLTNKLDFRRTHAGEKLITEGEAGRSFFIVVSGKVKVTKATLEGEVTLATLGEGTFFGEMAVLSSAPRLANVVAIEESELLEISDVVLMDLVRDHAGVIVVLKKFYRQRLLSNVMNMSPLFKVYDRAERRSLIEKFRLREIPAGQAAITEGTKSDGLYVVMHGALKAVKKTDDGTLELGRLREGDIFGEMSLLTLEPAMATVLAERRSLVLRLAKSDFDLLKFTHPQMLEVVSDLTAQRKSIAEHLLAGEHDSEDGIVII